MTDRRFVLGFAAAAALAIAWLAVPSMAQAPSLPPPPYNVDIGALFTSAQRAAASSPFNSATQTNLAGRGVVCTYNQTAASGSPSTTFNIQYLDAATASWVTLGTSGAITASTTPESLMVYDGIQTASLPSHVSGSGLKLPVKWRAQLVVAGTSTPATTGILGCNTLR